MTDRPEILRAFPLPVNDLGDAGYDGMSLGDYFAAHCPVTMTEFLTIRHQTPESTVEEVVRAYAEFRFGYADEMLKSRKP